MGLKSSGISRRNEVLWEKYDAFVNRDLSDFDVAHPFKIIVNASLRQLVTVATRHGGLGGLSVVECISVSSLNVLHDTMIANPSAVV